MFNVTLTTASAPACKAYTGGKQSHTHLYTSQHEWLENHVQSLELMSIYPILITSCGRVFNVLREPAEHIREPICH